MSAVKKIDIASGFRYLEYPCNFKECIGSLIFIHGAGEWGSSLDRIKRYGLPRLLARSEIELNCKVVCPQLEEDGEWCPERLQAFADMLNTESSVLAVVGFSRGGKAVCNWISEYGVIAPLAVVIAGREDKSVSRPLEGLSLVSIQGDQDPYPNMAQILEHCRLLGADVTEIILAGRDHFISEEVFAHSKLKSILAGIGIQIHACKSIDPSSQV